VSQRRAGLLRRERFVDGNLLALGRLLVIRAAIAVCTGCVGNHAPAHGAFDQPAELVTIQGYDGLTEDPYITSDEKYLLFDSAGSSEGPISIFCAKKIDYKTFAYVGELQGIGTDGGAAPAIDNAGNLYFLTGRSYMQDFASIWRGTFDDCAISDLASVAGISKQQTQWFNMGAVPDRGGNYLVFSDNGPRDPMVPNLPEGVSHIVIAKRNADDTYTRLADSDELMANVNTVRDITDFTYDAALASDDLEIFFTAPGGADSIYVAERTSITEPFDVAQLLDTGDAAGFAEGSSVTIDGKHLYYHKVIMSPTAPSQTAIYVLSRP